MAGLLPQSNAASELEFILKDGGTDVTRDSLQGKSQYSTRIWRLDHLCCQVHEKQWNRDENQNTHHKWRGDPGHRSTITIGDESGAIRREISRASLSIASFMKDLSDTWSYGGIGRLAAIIKFPLAVVSHLPAALYRIGFKATSIAYAPFVWVAHQTLDNPLSLRARLERITKGEFEKVRRGLSWLVLGIVAAKTALIFEFVNSDFLVKKMPSRQIVSAFVVPGSWPWWQLTLVTDALLTFALFWFADAVLVRIDQSERVWPRRWVEGTVSGISFLRGVLAIVTMSHGFYLALIGAELLDPDTIGKLFT